MIIDYTVYYEDGTSGVISCEKPPGAHPTSIKAILHAIAESEKTGKVVHRIGRTTYFRGVLIDRDMATRKDIFNHWSLKTI